MSVGLLYFAHERAEFSTTIRVSQRGVAIGDPSVPVAELVLPSAVRNLVMWKGQEVPGNASPSDSVTVALQENVTEISTTSPPNELNGYVNVVDGSVSLRLIDHLRISL